MNINNEINAHADATGDRYNNTNRKNRGLGSNGTINAVKRTI